MNAKAVKSYREICVLYEEKIIPERTDCSMVDFTFQNDNFNFNDEIVLAVPLS